MSKELNLSKLREEINKIDAILLLLLKKRFKISEDIGKYKVKNNLPVEDKKREKEIVNSRIAISGLNKEFISDLFNLIFKESKRLQRGLR